MEIQELRIGNFVSYEGEILPICSLHSDSTLRLLKNGDSVGCYAIGWVDPILISKDILKKCGFKQRISSDNVLDYFFIGTNPITHDWLFSLKWIHGNDFPFYENKHHELKYLHQVQNLYFALTGEDLKINI